MVFVPHRTTLKTFKSRWRPSILADRRSRLLVWGMQAPDWIYVAAEKFGLPLTLCEDGFLRSLGLGASHSCRCR